MFTIYLAQSKVLHEHEVQHFWLVWKVLLLSGWIPACDHVTQSSQIKLREISFIIYHILSRGGVKMVTHVAVVHSKGSLVCSVQGVQQIISEKIKKLIMANLSIKGYPVSHPPVETKDGCYHFVWPL